MDKVTKRCLSGNGEALNSQLEAFDKGFEFDRDERKSSKQSSLAKLIYSSQNSKDAGSVADSDGGDLRDTTHTQNDKPKNKEGALEALMLTPRRACKKKSASSSFAGKSQPLRKNKRSLLKGFKEQMRSTTSINENSQRKADEILLSLTSTPARGPKRKTGSKQMPDELWAVVSHHNSKHGPDRDHSLDPESRHSDSSSVKSFADESDHHSDDDNFELTKNTTHQSKIIRKASSNHSPVGRRGRRGSRHLRLAHGNLEVPCGSPLVSNTTRSKGAALDRRKHRHELSKSCHGANVREVPFSPSQETKSTVVNVTTSQVLSPKLQHVLHSIPQSPGRRSGATSRLSSSSGQKARSTSEPRRKESRRMAKRDSSSASRRVLEKYSRPQRDSSVGSGASGRRRSSSYRQGSEESRQNRDIVRQSLTRANSIAHLDERSRSGQLTTMVATPPSPLSKRRSKKDTRINNPADEANSTGGRRRKPKVVRNACSRKRVS